MDEIKEGIIEALRNVFDPEIPVSLYDLGLIYDVIVSPDGNVNIIMTLTAPGCPVADTLPLEVKEAALTVSGVNEVNVELVFDPPWNPDMMTEAARFELGMF